MRAGKQLDLTPLKWTIVLGVGFIERALTIEEGGRGGTRYIWAVLPKLDYRMNQEQLRLNF